MKSQWFEYKSHSVKLRQQGMSLSYIERTIGVPRSTLSGWLRDVPLTASQKKLLKQNQLIGLRKARIKASDSHRQRKLARITIAKENALEVLESLDLSNSALLDLALAMLYMGEGTKSNQTAISSSSPLILRFFLAGLTKNYGLSSGKIKCELHLRADQNTSKIKEYWSKNLGVPEQNFTQVYFDKRTVDRPSHSNYYGVCVLNCGNVAIQRKLVYLYTLFCEQISSEILGD